MADEKEDLSKKCAQTGVALKKFKRYYRNGRYFISKAAFVTWFQKIQEEKNQKLEESKKKADEEQAAKATAEVKAQEEKAAQAVEDAAQSSEQPKAE